MLTHMQNRIHLYRFGTFGICVMRRRLENKERWEIEKRERRHSLFARINRAHFMGNKWPWYMLFDDFAQSFLFSYNALFHVQLDDTDVMISLLLLWKVYAFTSTVNSHSDQISFTIIVLRLKIWFIWLAKFWACTFLKKNESHVIS